MALKNQRQSAREAYRETLDSHVCHTIRRKIPPVPMDAQDIEFPQQQEPELTELDEDLVGIDSSDHVFLNNTFWPRETGLRFAAIREARDQNQRFAAATEEQFDTLWEDFVKYWPRMFFRMRGFLSPNLLEDRVTIRPSDVDYSGDVGMQSLYGFLHIAHINWLRNTGRGLKHQKWAEMISPSKNQPLMKHVKSKMHILKVYPASCHARDQALQYSDEIFVRYKISALPLKDKSEVSLSSSILSTKECLEVARSIDTFTFLDPKTNYVSRLTPKDFFPFYETLEDTWFYQQEVARDAALMVNDTIHSGLEDLEAKMTQMVPKTFGELRKALNSRASNFSSRSININQNMAGDGPDDKPIEDYFLNWLRDDIAKTKHKQPQ
ncbi:unnamed protein product [Fusarium venenatum]|uniref:Uncharacterized protein n=1 Tax=Fusarium venenatum TaxID=56646 RepID=A0A2L2SRE6_9HYPO|nr:uncharacterized protein FVRRES_12391 [Fusarium venenatum]CEI39700.1 unnamed protein product [Fusarium venenatum]